MKDAVLDGQLFPSDWIAPRREFVVTGFGGRSYPFGFDAVKVPATGGTTVWRAWCIKCGSTVPPDMDSTRQHAMLHLAVDLAGELK